MSNFYPDIVLDIERAIIDEIVRCYIYSREYTLPDLSEHLYEKFQVYLTPRDIGEFLNLNGVYHTIDHTKGLKRCLVVVTPTIRNRIICSI